MACRGNNRGLATYIGGKNWFSPYPFLNKECTKLLEPCVGGCMALEQYKGNYCQIVINDKNPNICELYRIMKNPDSSVKILDYIKNNLSFSDRFDAEALWNKCVNITKDRRDFSTLDIERAGAYWFKINFSFNGKGGHFSKARAKAKSFENIHNRLRLSCAEMQKITGIRNDDVQDIVQNYKDDASVQALIDPPYVGLYRSSRNAYECEMSSLQEHILLARKLRHCKMSVILHGYRADIEGVPTVYDAVLGSDWKCFLIKEKPNHCQIVKKGEHKAIVNEYIWVNKFNLNRAEQYYILKDCREDINSEEEYWNRIKECIAQNLIKGVSKNEYIETYKSLYGKELI